MIKSIVTDKEFLQKKSVDCDITDSQLVNDLSDLIDTAVSVRDRCAGLAFNQIGILKRGFVIKIGDAFQLIINPKLISKSPTVKARFESCLSLPGRDPTRVRRSVTVKISYYDPITKEVRIQKFGQFEARVVQHEMDHLNGVLI